MTATERHSAPRSTPSPAEIPANGAASVDVEVAHEALVRHWERLQTWLGEDRVGLQLRQEISDAAQTWADRNRHKDYLAHQGSRLTEVEALRRVGRLALNELEASYLEACFAVREQEIAEEQAQQAMQLRLAQESARNEESRRHIAEQAAAFQRRSAARFRWLSIVLAALVILGTSLSWYAYRQRQDAREQADFAQSLGLTAASRDLANGGVEDELAALLGVEAAVRGADLNLDAEVGTALQASIGAPYFSRLIDSENPSSAVSLAFHPNGSFAVVGKFDGSVTLVDLTATPATAQPLVPDFTALEGGDDRWVSSVAFSPDGQYLAAVAYSGAIQVWNLASGGTEAIDQPLELPRAVYQLSFGVSPTDGVFLLAAACSESRCANDLLSDPANVDDSGSIGTVVVTRWFASTNFAPSSALTVELPGNRVYATAISSKGRWLAAGGCKRFSRPPAPEPHSGNDCEEGFLYLLDLERPEAPPVSFPSEAGAIMAVAFAPGEATLPQLAAGGEDRMIRIWQTTGSQLEQRPIATLTGHDEEIRSLSFSPTEPLLVSGGHDGAISLWDLTDPDAVVEVLGTSTEWVRAVAFDSTGTRMLSAAGHGRIRLWEIAPELPLSEPGFLRGHTSFIRAIVFGPNPEQPMIISAAEDGTVRIWQTDDGEAIVRKIVVRPGSTTLRVSGLSLSGDGSTLAISDERGAVWRLNLQDPLAVPFRIGIHSGGPLHVAFDPNHSIVAAGGSTGRVQLWDASAGEPSEIGDSLGDGRSQIWAVAYSPDGSMLAAGSAGGTIQRWRIADDGRTAEPLPSFTLEGVAIRSLAFGPENTLVTGGSDGQICFWGNVEPVDLSSCPRALAAHTGDVRSLAFNPNGDLLASGGIDQTVRIWNPAQADASPIVIPTIMEWVRGMAFAPDGKTLAVSSTQGTIRLILPDSNDLVERACDRVGRAMTHDEWEHYLPDEQYRATCAERQLGDQASAIPREIRLQALSPSGPVARGRRRTRLSVRRR